MQHQDQKLISPQRKSSDKTKKKRHECKYSFIPAYHQPKQLTIHIENFKKKKIELLIRSAYLVCFSNTRQLIWVHPYQNQSKEKNSLRVKNSHCFPSKLGRASWVYRVPLITQTKTQMLEMVLFPSLQSLYVVIQ